MVGNYPQDDHKQSKGMVKHHPQDGHQLTEEWSTTFLGMVITFLRTVTHHFQDGQLDWSLTLEEEEKIYFYKKKD